MRVAIICFTSRGADTAVRIREVMESGRIQKAGKAVTSGDAQKESKATKEGEAPKKGEAPGKKATFVRIWCAKEGFLPGNRIELLQKPLRRWTEEAFAEYDALVFVGATGIAVRSIAPFLRSKTSDPAVLCVDELGKFVIPLVSGHIGGANELAAQLAERLGAVAVITTATDLNGRFAVDVFAKKNQLWISDMKLAKRISAELLDGHEVGFCSDFPWDGELPEGLVVRDAKNGEITPERIIVRGRDNREVWPGEFTDQNAEDKKGSPKASAGPDDRKDESGTGQKEGFLPEYGICVSLDTERQPFAHTLHLVPQIAVLGIGCRRGKSPEELEQFVRAVFAGHRVSEQALCMVCSHEVKADEHALLQFCEARGLPFQVYTAEELNAAKGTFSASRFVEVRVGVDNVCERSAALGSDGELLIPKTAENGMTVALALKKWKPSFR